MITLNNIKRAEWGNLLVIAVNASVAHVTSLKQVPGPLHDEDSHFELRPVLTGLNPPKSYLFKRHPSPLPTLCALANSDIPLG